MRENQERSPSNSTFRFATLGCYFTKDFRGKNESRLVHKIIQLKLHFSRLDTLIKPRPEDLYLICNGLSLETPQCSIGRHSFLPEPPLILGSTSQDSNLRFIRSGCRKCNDKRILFTQAKVRNRHTIDSKNTEHFRLIGFSQLIENTLKCRFNIRSLLPSLRCEIRTAIIRTGSPPGFEIPLCFTMKKSSKNLNEPQSLASLGLL